MSRGLSVSKVGFSPEDEIYISPVQAILREH